MSFAGPWVLVWPSDDPSQAPIEMRLLIERHEGDAYALRTTLAGVYPATFLRPDDWTLLVEEGQLAIAMGDEPLTAYLAASTPSTPPLIGPSMADLQSLPEHIVGAEALSCLEFAADACATLEQDGPLVAGCRELHWSFCLDETGPPPADPTQRAAHESARELRLHARVLQFSLGLRRASVPVQAAAAVYQRALEQAAAHVDSLESQDPIIDEPALAEIQAVLAIARALGQLPP